MKHLYQPAYGYYDVIDKNQWYGEWAYREVWPQLKCFENWRPLFLYKLDLL